MSIRLTRAQRQVVEQSEEPPRFVDPDNKREYVLLRAEVYERMRRLLESEVVDPSFYEFEEPADLS